MPTKGSRVIKVRMGKPWRKNTTLGRLGRLLMLTILKVTSRGAIEGLRNPGPYGFENWWAGREWSNFDVVRLKVTWGHAGVKSLTLVYGHETWWAGSILDANMF